MSFVKYKSLIEVGDTVVVYLNVHSIYSIVVKEDGVFQTKYGALKHSDIIGCQYGSRVNCSRGWVYVLFPTPELWTLTLPHRTQILYTPDISLVIMQLELKPGSVICEAGTGSGSLSHALARAVAPNGSVFTFDFHKQRVELAEKEFAIHGLGHVIKVQHKDVCSNGFELEGVADAVFLDLPHPWDVIPSAAKAIKYAGGRICSFSPCIEQVQQTCIALKSQGFSDITTMECVQRQFEVKSVSQPVLNPPKERMTTNEKDKETRQDASNIPNLIVSEVSKLSSAPQDTKISSRQTYTSRCDTETFWTALPSLQIAGHTGYLTFATLSWYSRCSMQEMLCGNCKK